jgi:gamma-tubulin complex component 2
MQTCTMFAKFTGWLSRELQNSDPDLSGMNKPTTMSKEQWRRNLAERERHNDSVSSGTAGSKPTDAARMEKMMEIIKKYEFNFSRHLQILLDALNHYAATETVVLLGLCARLSTANQGTEYAGLRTDQDGVAT